MPTLNLFEQAGVEVGEPEPTTEVRLGHRAAQIPLRKKRKEACNRLLEILEELEGKDIYISYDPGSQNHFRLTDLKLSHLQVGHLPKDGLNSLSLWGRRGSSILIDTSHLFDVREQEAQGYTQWLLDFWNGFWGSPISPHLPAGFTCLHITLMKD